MWQNDLVIIVRALINDLDSAVYTDARLCQIIVIGAYQVVNSAIFDNNYSINISSSEITPDPVVSEDKDFCLLVAYKTACIILNNEVKSLNAVIMKDGPSYVDTRESAKNIALIAKDICSKYEDMLNAYILEGGIAGTGNGQAILGPYSPGADLINWNINSHRDNGWR